MAADVQPNGRERRCGRRTFARLAATMPIPMVAASGTRGLWPDWLTRGIVTTVGDHCRSVQQRGGGLMSYNPGHAMLRAVRSLSGWARAGILATATVGSIAGLAAAAVPAGAV